MSVVKFVRTFLKGTAKVCVALTNGDILYEGTVRGLCWEHCAAGMLLVSVEGLGSEGDLILTVAKEAQV